MYDIDSNNKNSNKDITVIYHADCPDGFSGAWTAWKKFKDKAIYIPLYHNMPLPPEVEDRDVYLIDFTYTDQQMLNELFEKAKRVVLIDHHITTKPFLDQFEGYDFDLKHSGAAIAWRYFHPKVPMPKLLSYIEAIDLGRFDEPNVKEVDQLTNLYEYNFDIWDSLIKDFENAQKRFEHINTGKILLKKMNKEVEKIVSLAEDVEFEGVKCKMVNTPIHVSYVGEALYSKYPPMSVIWSRRRNLIVVSLRSDGSVDVAKIAEKYGGGGHRKAAAFRWEADHILHFPGIKTCISCPVRFAANLQTV